MSNSIITLPLSFLTFIIGSCSLLALPMITKEEALERPLERRELTRRNYVEERNTPSHAQQTRMIELPLDNRGFPIVPTTPIQEGLRDLNSREKNPEIALKGEASIKINEGKYSEAATSSDTQKTTSLSLLEHPSNIGQTTSIDAKPIKASLEILRSHSYPESQEKLLLPVSSSSVPPLTLTETSPASERVKMALSTPENLTEKLFSLINRRLEESVKDILHSFSKQNPEAYQELLEEEFSLSAPKIDALYSKVIDSIKSPLSPSNALPVASKTESLSSEPFSIEATTYSDYVETTPSAPPWPEEALEENVTEKNSLRETCSTKINEIEASINTSVLSREDKEIYQQALICFQQAKDALLDNQKMDSIKFFIEAGEVAIEGTKIERPQDTLTLTSSLPLSTVIHTSIDLLLNQSYSGGLLTKNGYQIRGYLKDIYYLKSMILEEVARIPLTYVRELDYSQNLGELLNNNIALLITRANEAAPTYDEKYEALLEKTCARFFFLRSQFHNTNKTITNCYSMAEWCFEKARECYTPSLFITLETRNSLKEAGRHYHLSGIAFFNKGIALSNNAELSARFFEKATDNLYCYFYTSEASENREVKAITKHANTNIPGFSSAYYNQAFVDLKAGYKNFEDHLKNPTF